MLVLPARLEPRRGDQQPLEVRGLPPQARPEVLLHRQRGPCQAFIGVRRKKIVGLRKQGWCQQVNASKPWCDPQKWCDP